MFWMPTGVPVLASPCTLAAVALEARIKERLNRWHDLRSIQPLERTNSLIRMDPPAGIAKETPSVKAEDRATPRVDSASIEYANRGSTSRDEQGRATLPRDRGFSRACTHHTLLHHALVVPGVPQASNFPGGHARRLLHLGLRASQQLGIRNRREEERILPPRKRYKCPRAPCETTCSSRLVVYTSNNSIS